MKNCLKFSLAATALLLLPCLAGCKSEPPNLASQIGPITSVVEPMTTPDGAAIQQVRYTFTNNGPKEIGAVQATLQAFDANGKKTSDYRPDWTIFASGKKADRIRPGQAYTTPIDEGMPLRGVLRGDAPAVRVEATVTVAEENSGVEAP